MTRKEAIQVLKMVEAYGLADEAKRMAIEALNAQKFDEVEFDMNEFFSIVDDGKIIVIRRGRGRVIVERPSIRMETTICSYGERSE